MRDAPDCLFCRIVAREIPADELYRDEDVVAFRDINPRAPTHVLVIPTRHIPSARELTASDGALLGTMFDVLGRVARDEGVAERGYRVVTNAGPDSGQTVDHLHFHLLGGRTFSWPPG